jgi:RNA polymerase sigma factor for flagellar operon FliA
MERLANNALGSLEREELGGVEVLWRAYWADTSDEHRNRLVEAYQRLVKQVVRRFGARLPRTVDRGDLMTAGNVGLMGAIVSYDPGRRVRFEVYAERRIRGALLDELRTEDWLPRPWRQRLELHKRTVESLRSELARDPYDHEVAEVLGLSFDDYESLYGVRLPGPPGGGAPVWDDGEEFGSSLEVVPDTKSASPAETLTRTELLRLMAQRMSEQEYRIVYLKYWEELTMHEIGQLVDLSESRVCKIHSHLIERLKSRFQSGV